LLDYLKTGDTIEDFLTDFGTVRRDQAIRFLELATWARPRHEPSVGMRADAAR
jgi:uncharacterized protein (DUF433 family)